MRENYIKKFRYGDQFLVTAGQPPPKQLQKSINSKNNVSRREQLTSTIIVMINDYRFSDVHYRTCNFVSNTKKTEDPFISIRRKNNGTKITISAQKGGSGWQMFASDYMLY
jgi:hypothetical protein